MNHYAGILGALTSASSTQILVSTSPWLLNTQYLFPGRVVALVSSLSWSTINELAKQKFNQLISATIATGVVLAGAGLIGIVTPMTGAFSCAGLGIGLTAFYSLVIKIIFRSSTEQKKVTPALVPIEPKVLTPDETIAWLNTIQNPHSIEELKLDQHTLNPQVWNSIANKFTSLSTLIVNGKHINGFSSDKHICEPIQTLIKLKISNVNQTNVMNLLKLIPNLKSLLISRSHLNSAMMKCFGDISSLITLRIDFSTIEEMDPLQSSIETLGLYQTEIPSLDCFAGLTSLKIAFFSAVNEKKNSSLVFLRDWVNLECLAMPAHATTETLTYLSDLTKLSTLILSNIQGQLNDLTPIIQRKIPIQNLTLRHFHNEQMISTFEQLGKMNPPPTVFQFDGSNMFTKQLNALEKKWKETGKPFEIKRLA